jgi:hypothetical protein
MKVSREAIIIARNINPCGAVRYNIYDIICSTAGLHLPPARILASGRFLLRDVFQSLECRSLLSMGGYPSISLQDCPM